MLQESPGDRELRRGLAETYTALGALYQGFGENDRNVEVRSQAIELLEELWAEQKEVKIACMLGDSYSSRRFRGGGMETMRQPGVTRDDAPKSSTRRSNCAKGRNALGGSRQSVPPLRSLGPCLQGVKVGRQVLELETSLPSARIECVRALGNAAFMYVEERVSHARETLLREALDVNHRNMRRVRTRYGIGIRSQRLDGGKPVPSRQDERRKDAAGRSLIWGRVIRSRAYAGGAIPLPGKPRLVPLPAGKVGGRKGRACQGVGLL